MLDLFGRGYVIEHCIAVLKKEKREATYKYYVTDCLNAIARSLGAKVTRRYYDIVNPQKNETRTAQEIVNEITRKAGLKVVNSSE